MSELRTMLLIGTGGFVGSHVRQSAEAAGLHVVGASRQPGGDEVACDLLDPASVAAALDDVRPQAVVNVAGSASVAGSWRHPDETFAINAAGVLNLLDALDSSPFDAHLLCVSSGAVYGEPERVPVDEEAPLQPDSPYGASKAAMEVLCGQYARSRGLRIAVVRSFNLLGPRQPEEFVASSAARQIAAAELRGDEAVTVSLGNLSAARDFTDVRDGARAYAAIVQRGLTGTFNLCSGKAVKISSLIELMRTATPLAVEVVRDPDLTRPADVEVVYGSPARLAGETGWRPEIPLERTVADLVEWWRSELRQREEAAA